MDEKERAGLTEEIIRLQRRLGHVIGQHHPGAWMALPLTIGQLKSLFFIDFEGSTNTRKLAAALNVTPPNVTGIIDRLVEQGLVTREENPQNRREQLLKTTTKGKTQVVSLRENGDSHHAGMLARLSPEELQALARGLGALARVAEHKEKDEHNRG